MFLESTTEDCHNLSVKHPCLVIDPTARDFASLLYTEGQTRLLGRLHYMPRQSDQLPILIQNWLSDYGKTFQDLTRIVVITGPGATTSVRLGVATAQALADGLGIPLVGVSTFEAAIDWNRIGVQFIVTPGRRGHWVLKGYGVKPVGVPIAITNMIAVTIEDGIRILRKLAAPVHIRWVHVSDPPVDRFTIHTHVIVRCLCEIVGGLDESQLVQYQTTERVRVQYAYDAVG